MNLLTFVTATLAPSSLRVADCRTCGEVARVIPPLWTPPCRCRRPRPMWLTRRATEDDLLHYPLYVVTQFAPPAALELPGGGEDQ